MAAIKRAIDVAAPPDRVWTRMTDFEAMPAWFYGIRTVAVLSPTLGVGTERALTTITGQSWKERIDGWDPPRSFSLLVLAPAGLIQEGRASVSLRSTPHGARLDWEIDYTLRFGPLGKALDRLLVAPVMEAFLALSLRRLRGIIERGSPPA